MKSFVGLYCTACLFMTFIQPLAAQSAHDSDEQETVPVNCIYGRASSFNDTDTTSRAIKGTFTTDALFATAWVQGGKFVIISGDSAGKLCNTLSIRLDMQLPTYAYLTNTNGYQDALEQAIERQKALDVGAFAQIDPRLATCASPEICGYLRTLRKDIENEIAAKAREAFESSHQQKFVVPVTLPASIEKEHPESTVMALGSVLENHTLEEQAFFKDILAGVDFWNNQGIGEDDYFKIPVRIWEILARNIAFDEASTKGIARGAVDPILLSMSHDTVSTPELDRLMRELETRLTQARIDAAAYSAAAGGASGAAATGASGAGGGAGPAFGGAAGAGAGAGLSWASQGANSGAFGAGGNTGGAAGGSGGGANSLFSRYAAGAATGGAAGMVPGNSGQATNTSPSNAHNGGEAGVDAANSNENNSKGAVVHEHYDATTDKKYGHVLSDKIGIEYRPDSGGAMPGRESGSSAHDDSTMKSKYVDTYGELGSAYIDKSHTGESSVYKGPGSSAYYPDQTFSVNDQKPMYGDTYSNSGSAYNYQPHTGANGVQNEIADSTYKYSAYSTDAQFSSMYDTQSYSYHAMDAKAYQYP